MFFGKMAGVGYSSWPGYNEGGEREMIEPKPMTDERLGVLRHQTYGPICRELIAEIDRLTTERDLAQAACAAVSESIKDDDGHCDSYCCQIIVDDVKKALVQQGQPILDRLEKADRLVVVLDDDKLATRVGAEAGIMYNVGSNTGTSIVDDYREVLKAAKEKETEL